MIYEKPEMEVMELEEKSIVCVSQGGTATEGDEPEVDWNL